MFLVKRKSDGKFFRNAAPGYRGKLRSEPWTDDYTGCVPYRSASGAINAHNRETRTTITPIPEGLVPGRYTAFKEAGRFLGWRRFVVRGGRYAYYYSPRTEYGQGVRHTIIPETEILQLIESDFHSRYELVEVETRLKGGN